MALIGKLEHLQMERNSVHGPVQATYSIFEDDVGTKYLQIDTYGSPDRMLEGKKSQSIQMDEKIMAQLRRILENDI